MSSVNKDQHESAPQHAVSDITTLGERLLSLKFRGCKADKRAHAVNHVTAHYAKWHIMGPWVGALPTADTIVHPIHTVGCSSMQKIEFRFSKIAVARASTATAIFVICSGVNLSFLTFFLRPIFITPFDTHPTGNRLDYVGVVRLAGSSNSSE